MNTEASFVQQASHWLAAKNWPKALDAAAAGLIDPPTTSKRAQLLAAYCIAARHLQRVEDAATTYQRHASQLSPDEQHRFYQMVLPAAIAAGRTDDVEHLLKRTFPKAHQGPIRLSEVTSLEGLDGIACAITIDEPQSVCVEGTAHWTYTTDPYRYAVIDGAQFLAGWDYVVTPHGQILSDSGYSPLNVVYAQSFPHYLVQEISTCAHIWPADAIYIDEDVLFLSVPERFHIGHWLVDFLPRLRVLDRLGRNTKVVVPRQAPSKFFEMLALFGIKDDRIIRCDLGARYRARSVAVAQPGIYLRPNPKSVRFVHQSLAAPAKASPRGRYFLERGVKSRRVINRSDLDAMLSEYGFRSIALAEMTIAEQRHLLADTEAVIGAFGSDLLCAYFMPENALLIEMIWDIAEDTCVRPTCQILGLRHEFLLCTPRGAVHREYQKDRDFVVDCAALRHVLDTAVVKKK